MAEAFVEIDGKACWRCGWCQQVHEEMSLRGGAYVKVASELVAVVCSDGCMPAARAAIDALFQPSSTVLAERSALLSAEKQGRV